MNRQIIILSVTLTITACATKIPERTTTNYADRVIRTPEPFAEGIISTKENNEFDITFTPDGKTAYFTRRIGNDKQKIWQTTFENGVWTNPTQLPFSTDRDETPFFSSDGKTLYFGSARPIEGRPSKGNFDINIWQIVKEMNDWGSPKPLNSTINAVQEDKEEWPSSNENFIFSLDNINFIYSTMLRGEKVIEIYTTTKKGDEFTKPEKITGLLQNDKSWKYSAD